MSELGCLEAPAFSSRMRGDPTQFRKSDPTFYFPDVDLPDLPKLPSRPLIHGSPPLKTLRSGLVEPRNKHRRSRSECAFSDFDESPEFQLAISSKNFFQKLPNGEDVTFLRFKRKEIKEKINFSLFADACPPMTSIETNAIRL